MRSLTWWTRRKRANGSLATSMQLAPNLAGTHDNMNPRRDYRFWIHRSHLEEAIDLKQTKGLEIGAHDLPFVEPSEGNCEFADFRNFEELKDLADRQAGHNSEFVVPVKYDLRNGYESIEERFDWIAAAHVIEHVPDLIWWLVTLASLLNDKGQVFLVIPDKRFTFDYHRRLTNLTDVVDANRRGLRTPSYTQVFDHHFYSTKQIDPGVIWAGQHVGEPYRDYAGATECAERALRGFEDAHCSVFTPESFISLMNDMNLAGLSPLRVVDFRPTQTNLLDFSAILERA
ncbi:methyltransferase domain-containing protein [Methylobacterium durans]|uniref:class I SAM-dependent methyltransferase n=1 Tax=Methylobacterium durans TaxID=2202825 RepID=UPI002AFFB5DD|nr:methyltransferase domain-containing protein [Methylobacterium durans]MEA1835061.1 methyltransferase domain-containing protein [Methylobacterium durans]